LGVLLHCGSASGILLCRITFIVNVISQSLTKGGGWCDCGIINIEHVQCAGGGRGGAVCLFQTVKTGTLQRAFQIEHSHNKLELKRETDRKTERQIERQRDRQKDRERDRKTGRQIERQEER